MEKKKQKEPTPPPEGEHKYVTVLFADVANYTSMSENLYPEEVHQIMDGCFNEGRSHSLFQPLGRSRK